MLSRDHMDAAKLEASRVLDLSRQGGDVPQSEIIFALWVLGDLFGVMDVFELDTGCNNE